MAYHGLIPHLKQYLSGLKHPSRVLEVGVDRGVTFLSLVTFLARTSGEFFAVGIDVLVQEQVRIMLANIDLAPKQSAFLVEQNSLLALPRMVEQGMLFDLILLDGDHNYHTVSRELVSLSQLAAPGAVIVVDDYEGRWSERDLWYAERDEYERVANATRPVETDKHSVKPAVDEWLAANAGWHMSSPVRGEPVVLMRA